MAVALPQSNDLLVCAIQKDGNGVAVADNRANQRQGRTFRCGGLLGSRDAYRFRGRRHHGALRRTPGNRENRTLLGDRQDRDRHRPQRVSRLEPVWRPPDWAAPAHTLPTSTASRVSPTASLDISSVEEVAARGAGAGANISVPAESSVITRVLGRLSISVLLPAADGCTAARLEMAFNLAVSTTYINKARIRAGLSHRAI